MNTDRPVPRGLVVAGLIVGVAVVLVLIDRAGPATEPRGPTSSSYAVGAEGLAAYAELLEQFGHPVTRLRDPVSDLVPPDRSTVVVFDTSLSAPEVRALRTFIERGGRLITDGGSGSWLEHLIDDPPTWEGGDPGELSVAPRTMHVGDARSFVVRGRGRWGDVGSGAAEISGPDGVLLVSTREGAGTVLLLADPSPLQNGFLARGDNAALALALAGGAGRPVLFVESVHGFGGATGLDALPRRWKWILGLAVASGALWILAHGRRLGPPEEPERPLPPPRRLYVDAMATRLARVRPRRTALDPARGMLRAQVIRRAGLPPDATTHAVERAARSLGLSPQEAWAIITESDSPSTARELGRALSHFEGRDGP